MARIQFNECEFWLAAQDEALARYDKPKISAQCRTHCRDDADLGAQFVSTPFTGALTTADIAILIDGRGRFMDNIFIERLRRSIKMRKFI